MNFFHSLSDANELNKNLRLPDQIEANQIKIALNLLRVETFNILRLFGK